MQGWVNLGQMCTSMNIYERHLHGKITEMKAITYYLENGFEIFYPITVPGKADFIIVQKGLCKKIQVKKPTWSRSGKHAYLQCRLTDKRIKDGSMYSDGDWDELIMISDDGGIWVAPWEDVKGLTSVCLDGTKPGYKPTSDLYNPETWRIH